MSNEMIHDRGRGPELIGTRITVYNLLPYFLDPSVTEADIARSYDLTPEQIAAARAFVLNNADSVLAEHLKIEERLARGNPPEVREEAERAKRTMLTSETGSPNGNLPRIGKKRLAAIAGSIPVVSRLVVAGSQTVVGETRNGRSSCRRQRPGFVAVSFALRR